MKKSIKVFHWLPRIICILAILFVSVFAGDAYSPENSFLTQLGEFSKALIPSFILLAILILAWKWEFTGGIIFIGVGLGMSPFIFDYNYTMNHSIGMSLGIIMAITFPFIVVGILFIISHNMKKKNQSEK